MNPNHENIDHELRRSLHHTGEQIIIDPGSLDTVKAKGQRRRTVRQAGLGACAVILGVGGGVVGLRALDSGDEVIVGTEEVVLEGTVTETTDAVEVTEGDGPAVTADGITWEAVPASSVVGYRRAFSSASGQFAALSTAPGPVDWDEPWDGRNNYLYRSSDGIDWQAIEVPEGLGVTDVGFVDGQLIAVGTAATLGFDADSDEFVYDPGEVVVAYPDDGWRTETLPLDIAAEVPAFASLAGTDVAVADIGGTTVVATMTSAFLDVYTLLGDRAPQSDNEYAYVDGDTILHVRWVDPGPDDPEGGDESVVEGGEEIVARYALTDLGIAPADVAAISAPPAIVYADDGSGFVEVARLDTGLNGQMKLVNTDDVGVLVVGGGDTANAAYVSTDGITWSPGSFAAGWVHDVSAGGLGVAAIGHQSGSNQGFLTFSTDGETWTPAPVFTTTSGEAYVSSVVVGDQAVAATVEVWGEPDPVAPQAEVPFGDGYVMIVELESGSAEVVDSAGAIVGDVLLDDVFNSGESTTGVVLLDDGTEIPVELSDLGRALDEAFGFQECCDVETWIVVSRDGVNWEHHLAADLFEGDVVGIAVQAVTPAGVIVRGSTLDELDTDRTNLTPQVVLGRLD